MNDALIVAFLFLLLCLKVKQYAAGQADSFRRPTGARQRDAGIPGYSVGEKLIGRTTQTSGNQWHRRADWQVYQPVVTATTSSLGFAASRYSAQICIKGFLICGNDRSSVNQQKAGISQAKHEIFAVPM
ncbi:hypothetical protein [Rheinheimera texasensis]|uniref:hypothetical protein n=1 Tax=Rheinheimera texasensis TaxID=306205 RepID=UPI0004E0DF2B|nr:hypothetical protein [Rheinheimera texasensis]